MHFLKLLFFVYSILCLIGCTDPNIMGLELQPESDNIVIYSSESQNISFIMESVDSVRSDEDAASVSAGHDLMLGNINDPVFNVNRAEFLTQILLTTNNIDLGTNHEVLSIVLSYQQEGTYGNENIAELDQLIVNVLTEDIYKDSIYYSNSEVSYDNINWFQSSSLSENNDILEISLNLDLADQFLDEQYLINNEVFLQHFKGIRVAVPENNSLYNTMVYLNSENTNSVLTVAYKNDENGNDTLLLDFELGGDAARINIFNNKQSSDIIEDQKNIYIQSMSGYRARLSFLDLQDLKDTLEGKAINKVSMFFSVEDNSQQDYEAHDILYLVGITNEGETFKLSDYSQGTLYQGQTIENNKYEFIITRYFYDMLNNRDYSHQLYLFDYLPFNKANRTILSPDIEMNITYSEL